MSAAAPSVLPVSRVHTCVVVGRVRCVFAAHVGNGDFATVVDSADSVGLNLVIYEG